MMDGALTAIKIYAMLFLGGAFLLGAAVSALLFWVF